jgi:hypothetical protein
MSVLTVTCHARDQTRINKSRVGATFWFEFVGCFLLSGIFFVIYLVLEEDCVVETIQEYAQVLTERTNREGDRLKIPLVSPLRHALVIHKHSLPASGNLTPFAPHPKQHHKQTSQHPKIFCWPA